jgi:uncharacterized protein
MISHCNVLLFVVALANFAFATPQADRPDVCPREAKDFAVIKQRAEAKDPVAQTALASCYDLGQHVQPDGKESIRLLTEAAGQGYAPAQYEIGRIYLYGRGIPADYAKALLWERKAADQGDPRAQRDLAFMYERGFGVAADPAQAAAWNGKAAAQGQPEAQLELARKFAQESDCAHTIHWYKEAAGHGHVQAMYELGRLYLNRCGPKRALALKWFIIGAHFGSDESKREADGLATALSAARKKHAEVAAAKWIKEHPGSEKEEDEEEKR